MNRHSGAFAASLAVLAAAFALTQAAAAWAATRLSCPANQSASIAPVSTPAGWTGVGGSTASIGFDTAWFDGVRGFTCFYGAYGTQVQIGLTRKAPQCKPVGPWTNRGPNVSKCTSDPDQCAVTCP
jgi:hypothetical protein